MRTSWTRLEMTFITAALGVVSALTIAGCGAAPDTAIGEDETAERSESADEEVGEVAQAVQTCVTIRRGVFGSLIDTQIASNPDRVNKNYGAGLAAIAGPVDTGDRRALVRADLLAIPVGATIDSAMLTLMARANDSQPGPVNAHLITSPWSEGGVTWANQPSFSGSVLASAPGGPGEQVFDLTSQVAAWVANAGINHGVLLEQAGPGRTNFITSEEISVSDRPKFEVCYTTASAARIDILHHCDPNSAILQTFGGSGCFNFVSHVIAAGTSYALLSGGATTTLYEGLNCTGGKKTIASNLNFCGGVFDNGHGMNDNARSLFIP